MARCVLFYTLSLAAGTPLQHSYSPLVTSFALFFTFDEVETTTTTEGESERRERRLGVYSCVCAHFCKIENPHREEKDSL
jgi:hypothetical protein